MPTKYQKKRPARKQNKRSVKPAKKPMKKTIKPLKTNRSMPRDVKLARISPQMGFGFPQQTTVRLKYCENTTITPSSGFSQTFWRANSIHDPRYAGGGHQPLGSDEWSLFYNHYVVLGSRIKYTITGDDSSSSGSQFINSFLSDDGTVASAGNISTLIESGRGMTKVLQGYAGNNRVILTTNYSAKKFFNVDDVADNLDRIGAAFGSDPTDEALFVLTTINTQAINYGLTCLVEIEYIVLFSEPRELVAS